MLPLVGISSTQVLPGASLIGFPASSVKVIEPVCVALDQVPFTLLPLENTQAVPESIKTVLGMKP
jgi:hypothetical protein